MQQKIQQIIVRVWNLDQIAPTVGFSTTIFFRHDFPSLPHYLPRYHHSLLFGRFLFLLPIRQGFFRFLFGLLFCGRLCLLRFRCYHVIRSDRNHVNIVPRSKSTKMQLIVRVHLGQELQRTGSQPGLIPRWIWTVQLEVIHIVVVLRVNQCLVDQQDQLPVSQQPFRVSLDQLLNELCRNFQFREGMSHQNGCLRFTGLVILA